MKRRSLLKSAAILPALSLPVPAQSPAENVPLSTIAPEEVAKPVVRFCSKDQFAALERLGDLLVPGSGGRPGAKEAEAAQFLDFLASESPAERQILYRTGLDRLNSESKRLHGKPFASLTDAEAGPLLKPLSAPWTYNAPADPVASFLMQSKEDFLRATINSRQFAAASGSRSSSGTGYYWLPIE